MFRRTISRLIFALLLANMLMLTFGIQLCKAAPASSYVVIKASFHTHTTASDGYFSPTKVVQLYANAGYDCIAITDHDTNKSVTEAKEAGERLGLIVIPGEEISDEFRDNFAPMHIVALWINNVIPGTYPKARTDYERIEWHFRDIHNQGGIGIVAHPWFGKSWHFVDWPESPWHPYRNLKCIYGWEIYFNFASEAYDECLENGFITINHDFHEGDVPLDKYTVLFAHNRTEEGVREALLSRRNVAVLNGRVCGTREAVMLAYQYGIVHTLMVDSSPIGVDFTVNGISHMTPWVETYNAGTLTALLMPEIYDIGEARYYWDHWSDGETSRSRAVTMNTNITLNAYYTGPYYELTVTSSPMTGVLFTINGIPKTTPYIEWLLEGSHTLEMPKTCNGYMWSHWLEDGDTNKIKTITLSGTTWTGVFVPAPPQPPVGGYSFQIEGYIPVQPLTPYVALIVILALGFTVIKRKTSGKTK